MEKGSRKERIMTLYELTDELTTLAEMMEDSDTKER